MNKPVLLNDNSSDQKIQQKSSGLVDSAKAFVYKMIHEMGHLEARGFAHVAQDKDVGCAYATGDAPWIWILQMFLKFYEYLKKCPTLPG